MGDEYKCKRCGYIASFKVNLKTHLERKKICSPTYSNISREKLLEKIIYKTNLDFKCEYCPKTLKTKRGIDLHQINCTFREAALYTKVKEDIIKELGKSEAGSSSIHTQNNNTNITNNNINNITNNNNCKIVHNNITITINDFGCESKDHILADNQTILESVKDKDIGRIVKVLHFNPYNPQNSNVRLHNNDETSEYLDVIRGGKWTQDDKKKTLIDIVKHAYRVFSMYECRNRTQLEDFCKKEKISYFDFMDWVEANDKYDKKINIEEYKSRIMAYIINRDLLLIKTK